MPKYVIIETNTDRIFQITTKTRKFFKVMEDAKEYAGLTEKERLLFKKWLKCRGTKEW